MFSEEAEEALALLADLSPADRAQLLRRLEVLAEFSAAERLEERLEEALGACRAERAFRQRLGWNPGRPAAPVPSEARRWARLERRLQARLAQAPAIDAATAGAAAAWLGAVQGGQALSTPAARAYWRGVCEHKIRMAPGGSGPPFWHACLALVQQAEGAPKARAVAA